MGHYDECREGYCGKCGQTLGNCEHTRNDPKYKKVDIEKFTPPPMPEVKPAKVLPICEFCHPEIESFFGVNYYIKHKSIYHQIVKEPRFCPNCGRDLSIN